MDKEQKRQPPAEDPGAPAAGEPAVPSIEELERELAREEAKYEFRRALLSVAGVLAVAAAIAALVTTRLLMPLKVNGVSMAPTLTDGQTVVLCQTKEIEAGDIIGFYYGGQILLKRVIAGGGDRVEIGRDGSVYINGSLLEEPYLAEKSLGECTIEFPCRVPEGTVFVLGDNRAASMDSRLKAIGCVESSQIIGRVIFRAWPLADAGMIR